jgi:hypothetical protein
MTMATEPRVLYNPTITIGRIVLLIGALIAIAASLNWIHGDTVNVFELGVGIAFLGLAL